MKNQNEIKTIIENNDISTSKSKILELGAKWVSIFFCGKNGINPKKLEEKDRYTRIKYSFGRGTHAFDIDSTGTVSFVG